MMTTNSKAKTITIDPTLLNVRSARPAKPVHPEITPRLISNLVDNVYASVRDHDRLGPLFEDKIAGDWEPHLQRMKGFWRSVLLKTGEYHGQPVPKHMAIPRLESDDFRLWLDLFQEHAHKGFGPEAASLIVQAAERIARSLWLAKFGTPGNAPPGWLQPNSRTPVQTT